MTLQTGRYGGQYRGDPPTLRDKVIAGGSCILVAWLGVWWAFYAGSPITILIVSGFATILTAAIGFAILSDTRPVRASGENK